jgi:hypothetical protein
MGERRGVYRILVGIPEGKRSLRRSRGEDNTKIELQKVGWGVMEWIDLNHDRDRLRALVNAVTKL